MGRFDVAVVGGCGHVGLPLALAFAQRGLRVAVYDISQPAVDLVNSGRMPFQEPGAPEVLAEVLAKGTFTASVDPGLLRSADSIVVVIGTPIDKHLNPEALGVPQEIEKLSRHLVDGQLLVLRSTLYPGVTRMVERLLARQGRAVDVAFCPERIAEGKAMTELFSLPQLVSGRTPEIRARAAALFSQLTNEIVELEPEEAELAKLFTNTWRYIKFATAN
ncbi:MAG: nucleotide sugar dehydrogenase, partial [Candidatus Dormibacteria bacterium]